MSEATASIVQENLFGSPFAEVPFVVVDVETTGISALGGDRITEVAAVLVQRGQITEVFHSLVNPVRRIPSYITELTGISDAMVHNAPRFEEIAGDLASQLVGRVFVAHNATFDWRFVSAEVTRASGRILTGRRLCTVRLARRLLPQLRSRSLDWVAGHYNVEIPDGQRHRAAGDAIATAHCLIRLLDDARSHGCERWSELETLLASGRAGTRRRRSRQRRAMPMPVDKDTTA